MNVKKAEDGRLADNDGKCMR